MTKKKQKKKQGAAIISLQVKLVLFGVITEVHR